MVGRLKQNTWKTEDGKNRSQIEIIAEHVEFKPFKKTTEHESDSQEEEAVQEKEAVSF